MSARVSRFIEHKVNMGNYESVTIKAGIEFDCDEGDQEVTLESLATVLDDVLTDEIRRVRRLASDESYIHEWNKPNRSRA